MTPLNIKGNVLSMRFRFLKWYSKSMCGSSERQKDDGLTLIECLVAIAVIAATIGVIAPITVLAVATRVQNQRTEQATLIAQTEVDRVRSIIERGGTYTLDIPTGSFSTLGAFPAPTQIDNATASTDVEKTKGVDLDSDGDDDFAVQVFRTTGNVDPVTSQPIAFELGVRVYKASSFSSGNTLGMEQAALTMTSGEGQGTTRPLSVIYTTIVKGDRKESLCDYATYMNESSPPASCSP